MFAFYFVSILYDRSKWFRFLFVQAALLTIAPVFSAWGLLGANSYYFYKNRAAFDYTWQGMDVKRNFIVIVPDRVSRSSYIAFKFVLNIIYAFTMTWAYRRGVSAGFAWYRIAASRADRDDYSRPSRSSVEANDIPWPIEDDTTEASL